MKKSEPNSGTDNFDAQYLKRLEEQYLRVYPEEKIPMSIHPIKRFEAFLLSRGRKIVFTKSSGLDQFYFEDSDDGNPEEMKTLQKFLGCGG